MRHFESGQLVDYVRGLLDRGTSAEVSAHLDTGCRRCRSAVAAFGRISDLAPVDARAKPADGVVRSVKALFAVRQVERLPAHRRLTLPLIEGGSSLAPASVGVRSEEADQRFTFSGAGLQLEIALQAAPDGEALCLHGELVHRKRGHLAGVPAFLVGRGEIVGQSTTNEVGCFAMEADSDQERLFLVLEDDRLIEIDLDVVGDLEHARTVQPTS